MLIYIGPRRATALLRRLRGDPRLPPFRLRTYAWLYRTLRLPAATYIFVGVDRLDPGERRLAGQFYRYINGLGPGFRALNDPATAMGRYRLLRTLHERGINAFNAYIAASPERPTRYPVFVRRNGSGVVPLTGLIEDAEALERELTRLRGDAEPPEDLLIIEFCAEPIDRGVFRKYAVHRIGDAYIPAPSMYGADWMVKRRTAIPVSEQNVAFDRALMEENPLGAFARQVFEIAGIEYGRVDMGMVNGRPQVYEVNFNPDILMQTLFPMKIREQAPAWDRQDELVSGAICGFDAKNPPVGPRHAPTLRSEELTAFRLRFWRNYAPQRY